MRIVRSLRFANYELILHLCIMRYHHGMRPQDIVILLKIIIQKDDHWQNKDLASQLYISPSEFSDSLNRSGMAGLLEHDKKKKVYRQSLIEFLEHGVHYVFPVHPGTMVNGMYTAHSHPFMQTKFQSELNYVWPDPRGENRGLSIETLYMNQVKAAAIDQDLYLMLALLDVIRVGKVRELKVAIEELKKMIV
jgi:hypothetical protein